MSMEHRLTRIEEMLEHLLRRFTHREHIEPCAGPSLGGAAHGGPANYGGQESLNFRLARTD